MGPVGAISMLSSLVAETGLPACIYRETRWAKGVAITADKPLSGDRILMVYDLIVTGAGIGAAADIVHEISGATTHAAVVLCGYGPHRESIRTDRGQDIRVEALTWETDVRGPILEGLSPDQHGAETDGSQPCEETGENHMKKKHAGIPPGDYNRQNLPPISEAANEIVTAIRSASQQAEKPEDARSGFGRFLKIKRDPKTVLGIRRPSRPR